MSNTNPKLKNAIFIALSFAAWFFITMFIMIALFQFTTSSLGWNAYATAVLFVLAWLIIMIAPPIMISSYMDPPKKSEDTDTIA